MTTENGTPLSPISEADELQDEIEIRHETPQGIIVRIPSDSSVTELDYGELLDHNQFDFDGEYEDSENLPRRNPDVADLVGTMMSGHSEKFLPMSFASQRNGPDQKEIFDDASVGSEFSGNEETASETTAQDHAETEDDLEYFSARSLQASSDEIACLDVITPRSGEG